MSGPKLPSCVEPWRRDGDGKNAGADLGALSDLIAAAEERGRRSGVEEREELRALLREWLPTLCAVKPWPKVGSMLACGKCLGCRTLIVLAPRDSAPLQSCCKLAPHPGCEGWPRDSRKEG